MEDKDNANAGVEAAEIGGHGRYAERGSFGEGMGVGVILLVRGEVFGRYHLLEKSITVVSM